MTIIPDTKDWTWVLDRPCSECGFDAGSVDTASIGAAIRANLVAWRTVLESADPSRRPSPGVWSPLEYACHVRDVHRVFLERVNLMLAEDSPTFANWDQDATAVEQGYAEQDPATVSGELVEAGEAVANRYDSVEANQWSRIGLRSNGSEFTVETIGLYHLHDVIHHAWDIREAIDAPVS